MHDSEHRYYPEQYNMSGKGVSTRPIHAPSPASLHPPSWLGTAHGTSPAPIYDAYLITVKLNITKLTFCNKVTFCNNSCEAHGASCVQNTTLLTRQRCSFLVRKFKVAKCRFYIHTADSTCTNDSPGKQKVTTLYGGIHRRVLTSTSDSRSS